MSALKSSDHGIITRAYYAVPEHYTIGKDFPGTPEGHAEAIAYAKSTITRFQYPTSESFSRAFVDRRYVIHWLPASGKVAGSVDESVERVEIFLTDAEQAALRVA